MTSTDHPTLRLSGPVDLLTGIPYLLGFHPHDSLVLVGLTHGALAVTARIDLADATTTVIADTVAAMVRGGSNQFIGAIYMATATVPVSVIDVVDEVSGAIADADMKLLDVLLVRDGLWWSLLCDDPTCCPPDGRCLPEAPSTFQVAATVAGLTALPSRDHLHERFTPESDRERLRGLVEQCERTLTPITVDGSLSLQGRIALRAVLTGLERSSTGVYEELTDVDVAGIGAALSHLAIRDAVWAAVDERREGEHLWLECARRLPEPYNAAPLFLYAWTAWRQGDGALASIAARRAIDAASDYSAAKLVMKSVAAGVDPRRLPSLTAVPFGFEPGIGGSGRRQP